MREDECGGTMTKTASAWLKKYAKAEAEFRALDEESRNDILHVLGDKSVRDTSRQLWKCKKTKRHVTVVSLTEEDRSGSSLNAVYREDGLLIEKLGCTDFLTKYESCVSA